MTQSSLKADARKKTAEIDAQNERADDPEKEGTSSAGDSSNSTDDPKSPVERNKPKRKVAGTNRVTIYSPDSALSRPKELINSIASDVWNARHLTWRLFLRNIKSLYRQTLAGFFWIFLPPLANTAMWVFINSIGKLDKGLPSGVQYIPFVMTGMVLWQAFLESFQTPLLVVQKNKSMFSRVKFPLESVLMVGVLEALFNAAVRLLMLVPVFFVFTVVPTPGLLAGLIALPVIVLLGTALGLLIMPVGSLFHDVGKGITVFIPFWMILTPVVYAPWAKDSAMGFVNWVNPPSSLLLFSRDMILMGHSEFFVEALICTLVTIPLFLLGLLVYRVSIPILVERIST